MAKTILYHILGHLHPHYAQHCHLFRVGDLRIDRRRDGSGREEEGIGSQIDGQLLGRCGWQPASGFRSLS